MWKCVPAILMVVIWSLMSASSAVAFGEDVLAVTGEYTFFIRPDPMACITYHKKLVPCVARETVPVPQRYTQTYPIPVPARREVPAIVKETPVGCAEGSGPCVDCYPQCSHTPGMIAVKVPQIVPVDIPFVRFNPQCVTRKVMLPQWFAVEELPKPPPQKVRSVQKVRPTG